ncbi:hypothetical protein BC940DRAFT_291947 [Gongronella butleri]|nr:hypothetical protein BC940DRAFT_291947 [Gongronella butleri]
MALKTWFILATLCLGVFASSDDDEKGSRSGSTQVKCNDLSTTVYLDAQYLANTTLAKDGDVPANEANYFIVAYKSAAAVSRKTDKQQSMTKKKLLTGIQAILAGCTADDDKLSGSYNQPNGGYRICLTGSEETDDC